MMDVDRGLNILHATCAFQGGVLQLPRRAIRHLAMLANKPQSRVGLGGVDTAKTSISMIVKLTIREFKAAQKGPDIMIIPCENWIDSHKVGPARAARLKMLHIVAMRIMFPRAHNKSAHASLLGENLNAFFEAGIDLHSVQCTSGDLLADEVLDGGELRAGK